jgi:hypothetical protein
MAGRPPIRQATGGAAGKLRYASGELINANMWLKATCGIIQINPILGKLLRQVTVFWLVLFAHQC